MYTLETIFPKSKTPVLCFNDDYMIQKAEIYITFNKNKKIKVKFLFKSIVCL